MHHFKRVLFCVFFLSSVFGVGFSYAQCGGGDKVGETVTFVWDSSNNGLPAPVTVNGVKNNYQNYILVNVVGGITYKVNSSNIVVCSHQGQLNHQRGSFTPNESGQVRIYYHNWYYPTTYLQISVINGQNTTDTKNIPPNQNNRWRIHFYGEQTDIAPESGIDAKFQNYLGYRDENESFRFFSSHVANSITPIGVFSNNAERLKVLNYFSAKAFMKTTRKGLYYVTLGADDGTRLFLDNQPVPVYDNWRTSHSTGYAPVENQVVKLTGSNTLHYEYFNKGVPLEYLFQISDANKIIENTIVGEQTICQGGQASPITGDDFKRRAQHNFNPTFQFQWHYATNPNGIGRTAIAGATQKDFTPDTKTTPFNQAGTYYLFREASVRFKNIGVAEKTEIIFSNAVKVTVLPQPIVSIDPPKELCQGADAQIRIEINNGSGGTPPFTFYYEVNDKPLQSNPSYNNIFYIPVNTSQAGTFQYKYLYVTDGNGCKVELGSSDGITVMAPSITAPENVVWCLPEIVSAVYDNNGNTTITQNSYVLPLGDTTLDVGVNSVPCCLNPTLKWTINNDLSKTRTGQPSTIGNISFENATSSDKVYTITYWLECNGQKYSHITRQVRITPRPQIHFSN